MSSALARFCGSDVRLRREVIRHDSQDFFMDQELQFIRQATESKRRRPRTIDRSTDRLLTADEVRAFLMASICSVDDGLMCLAGWVQFKHRS